MDAAHNEVSRSWNNIISLIDNVQYHQRQFDRLCDQEAEANKKALRQEMEKMLKIDAPANGQK